MIPTFRAAGASAGGGDSALQGSGRRGTRTFSVIRVPPVENRRAGFNGDSTARLVQGEWEHILRYLEYEHRGKRASQLPESI